MSVYGTLKRVRLDHSDRPLDLNDSDIWIEMEGVSLKLASTITAAVDSLVKQMLRDGR